MPRAKPRQPQPLTVTFATHNAFRGRAKFTPLADIIVWQEVTGRAARRKLRESLPAYRHYFKGELAISWRKAKYRPVRRWSKLINPGLAKVTPNRWVQRQVLKPVGRPNLRLRIVNTHLINGVEKNIAPVMLRRAAHSRGTTLLSRAGRTTAKRNPHICLGGADLNLHRWDVVPRWTDVRHVDRAKPGYDRALYVADPRLEVLDAKSGPRNGSDHASIHVTYRIAA